MNDILIIAGSSVKRKIHNLIVAHSYWKLCVTPAALRDMRRTPKLMLNLQRCVSALFDSDDKTRFFIIIEYGPEKKTALGNDSTIWSRLPIFSITFHKGKLVSINNLMLRLPSRLSSRLCCWVNILRLSKSASVGTKKPFSLLFCWQLTSVCCTKLKYHLFKFVSNTGSGGRTRTYNQAINSRLLYHWATPE